LSRSPCPRPKAGVAQCRSAICRSHARAQKRRRPHLTSKMRGCAGTQRHTSTKFGKQPGRVVVPQALRQSRACPGWCCERFDPHPCGGPANSYVTPRPACPPCGTSRAVRILGVAIDGDFALHMWHTIAISSLQLT
jgi:hypothetical protein